MRTIHHEEEEGGNLLIYDLETYKFGITGMIWCLIFQVKPTEAHKEQRKYRLRFHYRLGS